MNIKITTFESNYHGAQRAGNSFRGEYVLHNIDVYNVINVDGVDLHAVYQCAMSYDYYDYSCPSPALALSEDGGTSKVLVKINQLSESDFENRELIFKTIEKVKELCPVIDSFEKLKAVYAALMHNTPILSDFLDGEYADVPGDYIEDEASGLLALK